LLWSSNESIQNAKLLAKRILTFRIQLALFWCVKYAVNFEYMENVHRHIQASLFFSALQWWPFAIQLKSELRKWNWVMETKKRRKQF